MAARSALPEPKQDDSRAPALLGIDKSLVVRASPRPVRTERWDRLKVWWVMDSEALAGIALMREDVSATWPGPGGLMTAFMRHVPTDAHSYERLWRYVEAGSAAVVVRDFNCDRKRCRRTFLGGTRSALSARKPMPYWRSIWRHDSRRLSHRLRTAPSAGSNGDLAADPPAEQPGP